MLKQLSISLSLMLILASAGCNSMPPVSQPRPAPPAPPAWLMLPPPDLQTPLNGIISPSEIESKQQGSR
ncbi:hypothetical protein XB02_06500 [Pantoea ananatis]|nr:hypothetical protein XB02_06500 [Pantoea ananatis]